MDMMYQSNNQVDFHCPAVRAQILSNTENSMAYVMEQGEYHIYPEHTKKAFYSPSNNDASEKSIAFYLKNKRNLILDGNGSRLVFHGRISPFVLDGCENIEIKNLTIDYERPFYSQGLILEADSRHIVLEIPEQFPYRIEGQDLIFFGENWESNLNDCTVLMQEFDPATSSPGYNTPVLLARIGENAKPDPDAPLAVLLLKARAGEGRIVELWGDIPYTCRKGHILTISHEKRHNSGFFMTDGKNIALESIRIVHAGAMGVMAQLCENITLKNLDISLGPTSKGLITSNADATHFVNCSGKIRMEDCVFENMLDDGTNIHGIYTKVTKKVGPNKLEVGFGHFQQYGVNLYKPGDVITINHGHTVKTVGRHRINASELVSPERIVLTLEDSLDGISVGDFVENADRMPAVEIRRCRTGRNRPRGFLISTPKPVLIEDCTFNNCCYAIHIAGDTKFWYESGPVSDVLIRNNTFLDCGYQSGDYTIGVTPEYEKCTEAPYYHRNIRITDNRFETFTDGLLYARGVDGVVFEKNSYRCSGHYPKRIESDPVTLEDCRNTVVETPKEYTAGQNA